MFECKFCKSIRKNKRSLVAHEVACSSNPNRKTSPGNTGKISWCRGLTKETNETLAKTSVKISKALTGKSWNGKHTSEGIERIRNAVISRGLGGVRPSRLIEYNGMKLGSSYELIVAQSLDFNNIKWIQPGRLYYNDPTGKKRSYTPDFFLPKYNVFLDPKNDFLINNINPALGFSDIEKINLVQEQHGIKVLVLNKSSLSWDIIRQLIAKIA